MTDNCLVEYLQLMLILCVEVLEFPDHLQMKNTCKKRNKAILLWHH